MKTHVARFGVQKVALADNYDVELVTEFLTVMAENTASYEHRYIGGAAMQLLCLIRANPRDVIADIDEYVQRRARLDQRDLWLPTSELGLKMRLAKANPLYGLLSIHFPPEHRIWRYVELRVNFHHGH